MTPEHPRPSCWKHSTRANGPSLRPDGATIGSYVEDGGSLVMVGGYLTFGGIEGKARWAGTPVETALPVSIATIDDRVEVPSGAAPAVHLPDHPIAASLTDAWPVLLGYNQVMA